MKVSVQHKDSNETVNFHVTGLADLCVVASLRWGMGLLEEVDGTVISPEAQFQLSEGVLYKWRSSEAANTQPEKAATLPSSVLGSRLPSSSEPFSRPKKRSSASMKNSDDTFFPEEVKEWTKEDPDNPNSMELRDSVIQLGDTADSTFIVDGRPMSLDPVASKMYSACNSEGEVAGEFYVRVGDEVTPLAAHQRRGARWELQPRQDIITRGYIFNEPDIFISQAPQPTSAQQQPGPSSGTGQLTLQHVPAAVAAAPPQQQQQQPQQPKQQGDSAIAQSVQQQASHAAVPLAPPQQSADASTPPGQPLCGASHAMQPTTQPEHEHPYFTRRKAPAQPEMNNFLTATGEGRRLEGAEQPVKRATKRKMDMVLTVPGGKPEAEAEQDSKRRCVCVGELKSAQAVTHDELQPLDLLAAWRDPTHRDHAMARAVLSQVYTYMVLWRACYGFISCWFWTWMVYVPPKNRKVLYLSTPIAAGNCHQPPLAPDMTVLASIAWLQRHALASLDLADAFIPPRAPNSDGCGSNVGGSSSGAGGGGTDDPDYVVVQDSDAGGSGSSSDGAGSGGSSDAGGSGGSSDGAGSGGSSDAGGSGGGSDAGGASQRSSGALPDAGRLEQETLAQREEPAGPDAIAQSTVAEQGQAAPTTQQGQAAEQAQAALTAAPAASSVPSVPPVPLQLCSTICQGADGPVMHASCGGLPAVAKFFGPSCEGVAAFHAELAAYKSLQGLQGLLVPKLLGAGRLAAGVRCIVLSRVPGTPLSELDAIPAAVQEAAVAALQQLHRSCPGFVHGDVRLENCMVLEEGQVPRQRGEEQQSEEQVGPGKGAAVLGGGSTSSTAVAGPPRVMLLDFGSSRMRCSCAQQQREEEALRRRLQQRQA